MATRFHGNSNQYATIPSDVRADFGKQLLWGLAQIPESEQSAHHGEDRPSENTLTVGDIIALGLVKKAIASVTGKFSLHADYDDAVITAAQAMPGGRELSEQIEYIVEDGRGTYRDYTDEGDSLDNFVRATED